MIMIAIQTLPSVFLCVIERGRYAYFGILDDKSETEEYTSGSVRGECKMVEKKAQQDVPVEGL